MNTSTAWSGFLLGLAFLLLLVFVVPLQSTPVRVPLQKENYIEIGFERVLSVFVSLLTVNTVFLRRSPVQALSPYTAL